MRALTIVSGLLIAAASLASVPLAFADDTFETRAAGAVRVTHIDDIVWALTAPCDKGDDVQQRQCRRLRDVRASQLQGATMIVDADRSSFTIGEWDAQKKSSVLKLSACIKCSGVDVDGRIWYVVANKEGNPAPRFENGTLKVGNLHDVARTFPTQASAKKFVDGAVTAKVQLIVKIPPKAKWADGVKQGITLDMLGYRVYSPCDGAVVCASPKAGPGEVDKKACLGEIASGTPHEGLEKPGAEEEAAAMKKAMKPAIDAAKQCYAQHQKTGKAKLHFVIAGDGSISQYEQKGDFVSSPTGACIDRAVKRAAFPKSENPSRSLSATVSLP